MPRALIDETNNVYGALKVLAPVRNPGMRKTMWLCQCSCGEQKIFNGCELRAGKRTSCGKHCNNYIDETDNIYGFLKVLYQDPTPAKEFPDNSIHWICECQLCGTIKSISGRRLRNGDTKSCGCMKSMGEQITQKFLNENNISFIKEYYFPDLMGESHPLRFDFGILKNDELYYLIEYQGPQHFKEFNMFDHVPLEKRQEYDNKKEKYCKEHNIPLLKLIPKNLDRPQNNDFSKIGELIQEFEKELIEKGAENVKISYKYL